MKNLEKKRLWFVGIILLLIIFSVNNQSIDEKKEGFGPTGVLFLVIGGLLLIGPLMVYVPGTAVVQPAFLIGAGLIIVALFTLFAPSPTIPGWALVGGFVVLAIMMFRKK